MSDDEKENESVGRRFTSREISLAVGLMFNFGTLVWYVSAANARLETMRLEMNELKISNSRLVDAVNRNQLLEYRVTEIERRLRELETKRR
jgi:hypothetical protein